MEDEPEAGLIPLRGEKTKGTKELRYTNWDHEIS